MTLATEQDCIGMDNAILYFDGTDHDFLSNFALLETPIEMGEGLRPAITVEHAYQAAKGTTQRDMQRVLVQPTAGGAKHVGNVITLREDWNEAKVDVMRGLLSIKFAQPKMRKTLLATGESFLMEGNHWHDLFWGVCLCEKHNGMGRNWLGHLLMEVRDAAIIAREYARLSTPRTETSDGLLDAERDALL